MRGCQDTRVLLGGQCQCVPSGASVTTRRFYAAIVTSSGAPDRHLFQSADLPRSHLHIDTGALLPRFGCYCLLLVSP